MTRIAVIDDFHHAFALRLDGFAVAFRQGAFGVKPRPLLRRAQLLDPLSTANGAKFVQLYYYSRQYDRVIDYCRSASTGWMVYYLGRVYADQGRLTEGIELLERAYKMRESPGKGFGMLANLYGRAGRRVDAFRLINEAKALSRQQYISPVSLAQAYIGLGDKDQAFAMVKTVEEKLGPVDVLVNNAGTILVGPVENQHIENFEEAMRINFWPCVYTSFAVIPGMKRRRSGRIVNIGSIGGKIAVPHLLSYSARKFALAGFSQGLRAELAKDGISVTTVYPGLMRTGSPWNVDVTGQHGKEYSWFILADSLPGISMDARQAAREIVQACISRTGEVVLGLTAKCAAMLNTIAPNAIGAILAATNRRLLPAPGNGLSRKKGFENENPLTRSALTSLTRKAEVNNNEL